MSPVKHHDRPSFILPGSIVASTHLLGKPDFQKHLQSMDTECAPWTYAGMRLMTLSEYVRSILFLTIFSYGYSTVVMYMSHDLTCLPSSGHHVSTWILQASTCHDAIGCHWHGDDGDSLFYLGDYKPHLDPEKVDWEKKHMIDSRPWFSPKNEGMNYLGFQY